MRIEATETPETVATPIAWNRNHPYPATVTENRLLTGPGSEKETRHIELGLGESGIEYLPGDSAGIQPVNTCSAVDDVIGRLQFTGDEPVTDFYGKATTVREALTSWLMIGKLSSSTVRQWAALSSHPELADLVQAGNREKLDAYLWGREFVDLLEHSP
ncbi:MAG TPA: oxidoreductase, partial [Acidobacteriaceae bacterium]